MESEKNIKELLDSTSKRIKSDHKKDMLKLFLYFLLISFFTLFVFVAFKQLNKQTNPKTPTTQTVDTTQKIASGKTLEASNNTDTAISKVEYYKLTSQFNISSTQADTANKSNHSVGASVGATWWTKSNVLYVSLENAKDLRKFKEVNYYTLDTALQSTSTFKTSNRKNFYLSSWDNSDMHSEFLIVVTYVDNKILAVRLNIKTKKILAAFLD